MAIHVLNGRREALAILAAGPYPMGDGFNVACAYQEPFVTSYTASDFMSGFELNVMKSTPLRDHYDHRKVFMNVYKEVKRLSAPLRMMSEGGPVLRARRIDHRFATDLETEIARQEMTSEGGRCDPLYYTDTVVLGGAQSLPYVSRTQESAKQRATKLMHYIRMHSQVPNEAVQKVFDVAGLQTKQVFGQDSLSEQKLLQLERATCTVLGLREIPNYA